MKNLLFVLTALLLFSCSSSDESSNNSDLHPPAWIQGTWMDEETNIAGFTFSKDDFCSTLSTTTSCWKYLLNNSQGQVTAEEEISNTDYIVKIKSGGTTTTYHFRKYSATQIEAITPSGLNPVYKKQ